MKDLQIHFNTCKVLLDILKIKYGRIDSIKPNFRATSRWGLTKCNNGGFDIEISSRLLDDNVSDDALDSTIIHEMLHTCRGCLNHGRAWKKYAAAVMKLYPQYNIKACSSCDDKGVTKTSIKRIYKYQIVCTECGHVTKREKTSRVIKHPEWYKCYYCGGKLKIENIYEVENGLEY